MELPDNWSAMLCTDKIVIAMWKSNSHLPKKQIFISKDLTIKVSIDIL